MEDIRRGHCPLCGHNEIVRSTLRETSDGAMLPLAVAYGYSAGDGPRYQSANNPLGRLAVFVCRACGFSQLFTENPGTVPVDEALGTSLVKGVPKGGGHR